MRESMTNNTQTESQPNNEYYILLGNIFQMGFEIGISKDIGNNKRVIRKGRDIRDGKILYIMFKPLIFPIDTEMRFIQL